MSLQFDNNYYSGLVGYGNYQNYPHFALRAEWIYNRYIEHSFTREIWVIGAGWGWLVKEVRDLLPVGQKSRCKGIVFSQYEKDKSMDVVGLVDGAIELIDAENKIYPEMDIAVSWNFLDSLPPNNENKITAICNKLINKAVYHTHIICMSTNDPNAQKYIDLGYNIKTRGYWRDKFDAINAPTQHCVLVNYHTENNSRKTPTGWENASGLNIPLCGTKVSE